MPVPVYAILFTSFIFKYFFFQGEKCLEMKIKWKERKSKAIKLFILRQEKEKKTLRRISKYVN